jgi:ABC-type transporter Mla subunit MlaD
MALQDLTPQLRTRLSRMERAVGWFVVLSMVLLTVGFVYYLYTTAEEKGWFVIKAPYFTFTDRATGLKVGDPVELMGFEVGQIKRITSQPAWDRYNVYIEFEIKAPYYDYLWSEGSRVKVNAADFLGKRVLEVTKGTNGFPAYIFHPRRELSVSEAETLPDLQNWRMAQKLFEPRSTNLLSRPWWPLTNLPAIAAAGYTNIIIMNRSQTNRFITGVWNEKQTRYEIYTKDTKPYWLEADESAAVTERLERLVGQVEAALPNFLSLTNQLSVVLSNSASLTSNLNTVAITARPAVSNLAAATADLNHPGALGEWLLPSNINTRLEQTLGDADATLVNANTNLSALLDNLNRSLDSLAGITSNLNHQVETNTNLLSAISETVVHADQFVEGLKHHWLLHSAFKTKKTNAPPVAPKALRSPK